MFTVRMWQLPLWRIYWTAVHPNTRADGDDKEQVMGCEEGWRIKRRTPADARCCGMKPDALTCLSSIHFHSCHRRDNNYGLFHCPLSQHGAFNNGILKKIMLLHSCCIPVPGICFNNSYFYFSIGPKFLTVWFDTKFDGGFWLIRVNNPR